MPRQPGKRPSVSVRVFGACSKRFCARRTIGYRHQPDGFSRGKKLVACFLKLVARISKSEPLIFSLLRCGVNALKISFHFSAPEMSVLRRISHPCRDAIHRVSKSIHRVSKSIHRVPKSIHRVSKSIHRVPESIHRVPESIHRVPELIRIINCLLEWRRDKSRLYYRLFSVAKINPW